MFQICDDFEDYKKDKENNLNNHIIIFGKENTINIFKKSRENYINLLKLCNINNKFFNELLTYLNNKFSKYV